MARMPETISLAPPGATGRDDRQKAAKRFYDSKRWNELRDLVLVEEPLCRDCPSDRPTLAQMVHHVVEYGQRPDLGLVRSNLVPLCHACHAGRHRGGTQLAGGLRLNPPKPA